MYETYVTFLDAIILPHEYQELSSGDWNWDREKKTKAQGLKASLSSFQMITVFVTTKNVLDEVKIIASKLQKHEQDIFEAYEMVGTVIHAVHRKQCSFVQSHQISSLTILFFLPHSTIELRSFQGVQWRSQDLR